MITEADPQVEECRREGGAVGTICWMRFKVAHRWETDKLKEGGGVPVLSLDICFLLFLWTLDQQ